MTDLTQNHVNIMKRMLILEIKKPFIPGISKWFHSIKKEYVSVFIVDNDVIYLPYSFACTLFKNRFNLDINYHTTEISFIGELRPNQLEMVSSALNIFLKNGTISLTADTGAGKTVMSIYMSIWTKVMIGVIFHTKIFIKQWTTAFQEFSNAKIMRINEDGKIEYLYQFIDQFGQFIFPDVFIALYTQFIKIPNDIIDKIGCLIIDETHLMCTAGKVDSLLKCKPKYIIGCSATPERDDQLELIGNLIYGIDQFYLKNIKPLTVIKVITGCLPRIETNINGNTKWDVFVKSLYEDDRRTNIIMDIIKGNYIKHKIVVSAARVIYAENLSMLIRINGMESDYITDKKNEYYDSPNLTLVGEYQKIGAGFDEKLLAINYSGRRSDILILTHSVKKKSLIRQLVGRVMRADYPFCYDLVDDWHICNSHWNKRLMYYNEIGAKIITCDLREHVPLNTVDTTLNFILNSMNKMNI